MPFSHRVAPLVRNSAPPYRTPGTRRLWSTPLEWLRHASQLKHGRPSGFNYAQQASHLVELAAQLECLERGTNEQLVLVRAFLQNQSYRPPRGMRGGTAWQAVLEAINNTMQRRDALDREVEQHQRDHAAEILNEE